MKRYNENKFKIVKRRKTAMKMLNDLQGNPYKFYRGKGCENISKGIYFCSCFDIARGYSGNDGAPIIEAEIAVKNPLVVDVTLAGEYANYNYINMILGSKP